MYFSHYIITTAWLSVVPAKAMEGPLLVSNNPFGGAQEPNWGLQTQSMDK